MMVKKHNHKMFLLNWIIWTIQEVLEWKNEEVEIKVGNNAGQSKHPIIKITFYLCFKKKITKYKIK